MRVMRATWPTRFRIALCSRAHRIGEGGGGATPTSSLSNGNVGRGTLGRKRVIREGGAPIIQPRDRSPCFILLGVRVVIVMRLIVGCRKGRGTAYPLRSWGAPVFGPLVRTHVPAVRSRGLDVFHCGDPCQRRGTKGSQGERKMFSYVCNSHIRCLRHASVRGGVRVGTRPPHPCSPARYRALLVPGLCQRASPRTEEGRPQEEVDPVANVPG